MKYRNFRIAWSVAWGVVAVLLCVLWVRSYRTDDVVDVRRLWGNDVTIYYGNAFVNERLIPTIIDSGNRISVVAVPAGEGFKVRLWLPTLLAATLSIIPWLPRRFSLRTLLIATTLVAGLLGIIVWMSRVG